MAKVKTKKGGIIVMGSGRMGQIRAGIIYSNPRLEIIGIVDLNLEGAKELAGKYSVSAQSGPKSYFFDTIILLSYEVFHTRQMHMDASSKQFNNPNETKSMALLYPHQLLPTRK